jgi:hypothetical protein
MFEGFSRECTRMNTNKQEDEQFGCACFCLDAPVSVTISDFQALSTKRVYRRFNEQIQESEIDAMQCPCGSSMCGCDWM